MSEYKILTDSTTDLPFEILKKFDIETIPFKCILGNNTIEDVIDENRNKKLNDFYEKLQKNSFPRTAQPNPLEFINFFEKTLREDKDILFISFSSALSGGYNSSIVASKALREKYKNRKINIIDSKCASLGEGLLVYEASQLKKQGLKIDELTDWIEKHKSKIRHCGFFGDLSHLKRGGRLSTSKTFFGSILNILPIFEINVEGKIEIIEKKRGFKNTINFLLDKIDKEFDGNNFFISYSNGVEEKVKEIIDQIKKRYNANILLSKLGYVIGSHTGRNTVALFYNKK